MKPNQLTPDNYQAAAVRTECNNYEALSRINTDSGWLQLNHGAVGLCKEAGEVASIITSGLYYGKPLDRNKIKDELGDVLWFIALICEASGLSLEEVMKANVRKLLQRYPEKFTTEAYTNRDTEREKRAVSGFDPDMPGYDEGGEG